MNIDKFLENHQNQHIAIGLSGGVDSVVLLHLLVRARTKYALNLSAIHVHHGLHECADDWANFCSDLCKDWQVPFILKQVRVQPEKLGIEAAARMARYTAFTEHQADCVALAHHLDDQVETFCLAALRGAGVRGLAGMADHQLAGSLNIIRPLLHYSRQHIEQYAQQHQLSHITDSSNHNPIFLRNWLRHTALPKLRQHLPHANQHILTAIANLQDELSLINEINKIDYQTIHPNHQFNTTIWRTLSPARRRQQLILFTKQHHLGTPRRASVLNFEHILLHQQQAQWTLPKGMAIAYANTLFALPQNWHNQFAWHTPLSGCLQTIAPLCQITFTSTATGLPTSILTHHATIRTAQSGDVLPMKSGSKLIKKLLQEHHIPPFLRTHYPIIVADDGTCLAVVGIAINQRLAVVNGILPMCETLTPFLIK